MNVVITITCRLAYDKNQAVPDSLQEDYEQRLLAALSRERPPLDEWLKTVVDWMDLPDDDRIQCVSARVESIALRE